MKEKNRMKLLSFQTERSRKIKMLSNKRKRNIIFPEPATDFPTRNITPVFYHEIPVKKSVISNLSECAWKNSFIVPERGQNTFP